VMVPKGKRSVTFRFHVREDFQTGDGPLGIRWRNSQHGVGVYLEGKSDWIRRGMSASCSEVVWKKAIQSLRLAPSLRPFGCAQGRVEGILSGAYETQG